MSEPMRLHVSGSIEARRPFFGIPCVTVQNTYGGVLHYPVTTPFRRAT